MFPIYFTHETNKIISGKTQTTDIISEEMVPIEIKTLGIIQEEVSLVGSEEHISVEVTITVGDIITIIHVLIIGIEYM